MEIKIRWFGHACFRVKGSKSIIMDPYRYLAFDGKIAYPKIDESADIVTISHDHDDHNAHDEVKGNPIVIKEEGVQTIEDVRIEGFLTFHDSKKGKERGKNLIFKIEMDKMVFLHLGDIGEVPDNDVIEKFKNPDFLFIPVGGKFTIGPCEAKKIISLIEPVVTVPMHYKTCSVAFELFDIYKFLETEKNIKYVGKEVKVRKKPKKKEIWVFE